MKNVFEYNGAGDPVFFSSLKKAYAAACVDVGDSIVSYRTVQQHINKNGAWEMGVDWLGDYVLIIKRQVL